MTRKEFFKTAIYVSVILVLDQVTKYLIRTNFYLGESISIAPFFSLSYVTNTGVAFSFFNSVKGANTFFIVFCICVIALFLFWYKKYKLYSSVWLYIAWILIISGALGNLTDRILHGYVIDFLDFYIGAYHWPAFNVADSCISIGGTIIFLYLMLDKKKIEEKI